MQSKELMKGMSENFELSFSSDALLSRVLFLTSSTTITIFVEDADKEYEYEEIFEKIFPKELKIDCIFPTGGKPKLEEAFNLFGKCSDYGKTFFLADGDFDIVLGKTMIVADNFIYLKRYNIESYLLNEDAILQYMRPRLRKTIEETKSIVKYQEWINVLAPFYNKLFALHCTVQKYAAHIENVARNPGRFLNADGYPDETQFEAYKKEIEVEVPDLETKINTTLQELQDAYGSDISAFVCGKYYIHAAKLLFNTKLSKKVNYDEVKACLISGIKVDALAYIKEKLFNYIDN